MLDAFSCKDEGNKYGGYGGIQRTKKRAKGVAVLISGKWSLEGT